MSKLLEQINYPADLRKLKKEQLVQVSNELREELVNVVSETTLINSSLSSLDT